MFLRRRSIPASFLQRPCTKSGLPLIDFSLRALRTSVISALKISREYSYAEITEIRRDRRRGFQIPTGVLFVQTSWTNDLDERFLS
jgi:hypothetical protein